MELLSEINYTQICRLNNGSKICITIDDEGEKIQVNTVNGENIGSIKLQYCESENFHIMWMYLDEGGNHFKHQGIGRQALTFHKQLFDAPITATDDNGIRLSDGSHLTGDAPGFVRKMRKEGLIVDTNLERYETDS